MKMILHNIHFVYTSHIHVVVEKTLLTHSLPYIEGTSISRLMCGFTRKKWFLYKLRQTICHFSIFLRYSPSCEKCLVSAFPHRALSKLVQVIFEKSLRRIYGFATAGLKGKAKENTAISPVREFGPGK